MKGYKVEYYNWAAFTEVRPDYREIVLNNVSVAEKVMEDEVNRLVKMLDNETVVDYTIGATETLSDSGLPLIRTYIEYMYEGRRCYGTTYVWLEETPVSEFEF